MARESRDDGLLQTVLIQARRDRLSAADTAAPPPPLEAADRSMTEQKKAVMQQLRWRIVRQRPSSFLSETRVSSDGSCLTEATYNVGPSPPSHGEKASFDKDQQRKPSILHRHISESSLWD